MNIKQNQHKNFILNIFCNQYISLLNSKFGKDFKNTSMELCHFVSSKFKTETNFECTLTKSKKSKWKTIINKSKSYYFDLGYEGTRTLVRFKYYNSCYYSFNCYTVSELPSLEINATTNINKMTEKKNLNLYPWKKPHGFWI